VILKVANIRLSIYFYHTFTAPPIKEPPKTLPPNLEENPGWYGEFWIKFPLNQTLYPLDFGHDFKARSEFFVILNRVSLELFDKEGSKSAQPSRKILVDFVGDFTAWYLSLPDPLTPKKIVFPSQITLQ
jgi:hypothetical protein